MRYFPHLREFVLTTVILPPGVGVPRVSSTRLDGFRLDPLDPVDCLQSSETLLLKHASRSFAILGWKMGTRVDPNPSRAYRK